MTASQAVPWRLAMDRALYGEGGFYRRAGAPARHFRTSAHVSPQFGRAILRLATQVAAGLGRPDQLSVVDLGAGDGALLSALAAVAPDHWSLVGVDVAPRPSGLPARVEWHATLPTQIQGLVVANEYLDVVALDVAELTPDGPRLVLVTPDGDEAPGGRLSGDDAAWVDRWWPLREIGDRVEIGLTRDVAWRAVTSHLARGVAVAIDYAADPAVGATLTGYRDGRQVRPVPDGRSDLTAHVRFESLTAAGDLVLSQREALQSLGIRGAQPTYDANPAAYLEQLSAAGEAAELLDPGGLGSYTWLVHVEGDLDGQLFAAD